MKLLTATLLAPLALLAVACSSSPPSADGGRERWEEDADAGCTDTAPGLLGTDVLGESATAVAYKVEYLSGGHKVLGQICVPKAAGPHPVVVYNHGGFSGMNALWGIDSPFCGGLANSGFVSMMAQYRGETDSQGTSEGEIELCHGEVEDVLQLLRIVRRRCDVDRQRVVMFGHSHGGCISLKVAATGPQLKAVTAYVAPTEMTEVYRHTAANADAGNPGARSILAILHDVVGTPAQNPTGYTERDVLPLAEQLAGTPVMLIYAGRDELIPVENGCKLRAGIERAGVTFQDFHVETDGGVITAGDSRCPEVEFEAATSSTKLDGGAYFLLLKDQNHGGSVGSSLSVADQAAAQFLLWHSQH